MGLASFLFARRETRALAAHGAEVLLLQPEKRIKSELRSLQPEKCIKLGRFSCSLKSASSLSDLPDFLAMSERFACFSRLV